MQHFVHFKGKEITLWGFPGRSAIKNLPVNTGNTVQHRYDPWVKKILQGRKWQPTLVFLPGECPGTWRATVHGITELDTT